MVRTSIKWLYYITHIDNIPSIVRKGILSHEQIEQLQIPFTPIYDAQIVLSRQNKSAPNGKSLWSFANLYFQPRNPMLYRVKSEKSASDIVVVAVRREILNQPNIFVTTGNAASLATEIRQPTAKLITQIKKNTFKDWWSTIDDSKREIMAECLVPDRVPPELIDTIFVANHESRDKLLNLLPKSNMSVVVQPKLFFQATKQIALTPRLTVIEGDMFFSEMQTLTVSVNCVGVMGKGLASRVKYQYPDVYVFYQDVCKRRVLRMGKPFIYKREFSPMESPAADTDDNGNGAHRVWFLLFPTKQHWRQNSDVNGIAQGLEWVKANALKEGIQSLALPALGCGLGNLEWKEVGPLMCQALKELNIPIQIYLPTEKKVPDDELTKKFLLGTKP